jgi:hypothetical protein
MQNNHIHWSSAALSYTNIRSNTTPSLLTFIGTTDTATLSRDQSMPPTTTSKLFPLDAPIPSTFLRDIPIEPWLTGDCRVDFADKDMTLCTIETGNKFLDSIAFDVTIRLLEHRFECTATHLVPGTTPLVSTAHINGKKCLWISPLTNTTTSINSRAGDLVWPLVKGDNDTSTNVLYLLPFLWSDYYAPVTALRNHPVQRCYVPGGPGPVQEVENLTILNLDQHWRIELAKARFCDYIASGTREGLILADALGIPGLATAPNLATNHPIGDPAISITNNQIYSRDRAPRLLVALDRHDVDSAQAVVETFPFSLFRRVATLTKPFPRGPSDSNKTLVVILGSLRGGEKSWQSMYTHLLDKNNADLALMIGQGGNKSWSPYQRAKYIWEFPEYDDWADAIDEVYGARWRTTIKPRISFKSGIIGGVENYPGSGAIIFLARYWLMQRIDELDLLKTYDRVVLTRSDFFYKCAHNLQEFHPRYLWIPSGEDYGGVSDRHWIMNKFHVRKALRIYDNLFNQIQYLTLGVVGSNPEQLIRHTWTLESLYPHQIRRFPRVMYTGFVAGVDKSRWEQTLDRGVTEDGLNIKYRHEYHFAKCFCSGGYVYDYEFNKSQGMYTNSWQKWTCTNTVPPYVANKTLLIDENG